jgi:hypothetical protein
MARQDVVSASNYSPVVQILSWFFLAFGVLGLIARIATKLAITRRINPDDYILCVSMVSRQSSGTELNLYADGMARSSSSAKRLRYQCNQNMAWDSPWTA